MRTTAPFSKVGICYAIRVTIPLVEAGERIVSGYGFDPSEDHNATFNPVGNFIALAKLQRRTYGLGNGRLGLRGELTRDHKTYPK